MPTRPNILLMMAEQTRWDTIAALGNPFIQTPAIDRLVAEGTSFTSAYCTAPVCVASRCSLVLGRYAHQTGCTANSPMPQDETSLMEMLNAEGYQTHGVGKMHFTPDSHKLWGFESRDYAEEGGMREGDDYCDYLKHNGFGHIHDAHGVRSEYYYIPQPSQLPARFHNTQWVGDRSLEFLGHRDTDRPFFLWTSFIKPHPPFENPVPWNRLYSPVEMPLPYMPQGYEDLLTYWNRIQNRYKYRDQGFDYNLLRLIRAAYYAALSFVDYTIGRIVQHLADTGQLENTLIIYTADHGELLGDYGSFGKRSVLDPAARIPMVVRYPECFAAGAVHEGVVSNIDIAPTCLAAAGIGAPGSYSGLDMADVGTGATRHDGVIVQYDQGPVGLYGYVADEWKYYYSAADDREWLLRRLPGVMEYRNLAGHQPYNGVLADMRKRLMEAFRADGYEAPLDGDGWRHYPPRDIPQSPDAGQLYQDGVPFDVLVSQFPEGYIPRCVPRGGM